MASSGNDPEPYKLQQGLIYLQPPPPSVDSLWFSEFYNGILSKAETNAKTFSVWEVQYDTFTANIFDCGMMLAYGMRDLIANDDTITPLSLANRMNQNRMNFTLFQNLGYEGLMGNPTNVLSSNGDLDVPYHFYYFNGDWNNITFFGQTNMNASNFTFVEDPFVLRRFQFLLISPFRHE
ncbi:hypothetical protein BDR26DRAFT_891029 [Obelidium mucronatum]|nr:hypothetical protein BDR26DRAFT_891029 [Obelidium mucronatum]